MLYWNSFRRKRKINHFYEVLRNVYEIRKNVKIGRSTVPLLILGYDIALVGDNESKKNLEELKNKSVTVFKISDTDSFYESLNKLLILMKNPAATTVPETTEI